MDRNMKAAIFDMDGTLVDSMSEWRRLNIVFVQRMGFTPTPQEEDDLMSLSGLKAVDYYKEHFGIETTFDEICEMDANEMERIYGEGLPLKPGVLGYLQRLRERGVKCVVATATPSRQALVALNRVHLIRHFDFIFSTEILGGHKGETEFYEKLCAFIGEKPEDCVMFEDGLYAMEGARAAGLGVIGITDATNVRFREQILQTCDKLIDSFDELP